MPSGRTLASYVPELRTADDAFRLRLLLHEFAAGWQETTPSHRLSLIAEGPGSIDPRWDAFVAGLAEHLAYTAGIESAAVPAWIFDDSRYLPALWFAAGTSLATLRTEALVHTPAHFEVHGVLLARRELAVV